MIKTPVTIVQTKVRLLAVSPVIAMEPVLVNFTTMERFALRLFVAKGMPKATQPVSLRLASLRLR